MGASELESPLECFSHPSINITQQPMKLKTAASILKEYLKKGVCVWSDRF